MGEGRQQSAFPYFRLRRTLIMSNNILDLSAFKSETLDTTMPDGTLIHIPKPTYAMLVNITAFKDKMQAQPNDITLIVDMAAAILNSNIDGITFSVSDVGQLAVEQINCLLQGYFRWANNITANPT